MSKRNLHVDGEWIVATDAGPAYKTGSRYAAQIVAYRIHRDSTAETPSAEGAAHVGTTGINKAEYLATIAGLRLVADRMYVGDWDRDPVHVVTDNAFVVKQAIGDWNAGELSWHIDRLTDVTNELAELTGEQVSFWQAMHEESAGADSLARRFRDACDQRQRDEWDRRRLIERWSTIRQHLRDHDHVVCDAAIASALVRSYNGKSLMLGFRASQARQRARVEERKDELREAVTSVTNVRLREIRCVEIGG